MNIECYEVVKAMHRIICNMNNEEAYNEWIWLVPDEATDYDLQDIAEHDMKACAMLFRRLMKEYGDDGLFIGKEVY